MDGTGMHETVVPRISAATLLLDLPPHWGTGGGGGGPTLEYVRLHPSGLPTKQSIYSRQVPSRLPLLRLKNV